MQRIVQHWEQALEKRFAATGVKQRAIHEIVYAARPWKLDLIGTRTSCQKFLANWLSVLLDAMAYTVMQRLKVLALANTELARATTTTIRAKMLKISVSIILTPDIGNRSPRSAHSVKDARWP